MQQFEVHTQALRDANAGSARGQPGRLAVTTDTANCPEHPPTGVRPALSRHRAAHDPDRPQDHQQARPNPSEASLTEVG